MAQSVSNTPKEEAGDFKFLNQVSITSPLYTQQHVPSPLLSFPPCPWLPLSLVLLGVGKAPELLLSTPAGLLRDLCSAENSDSSWQFPSPFPVPLNAPCQARNRCGGKETRPLAQPLMCLSKPDAMFLQAGADLEPLPTPGLAGTVAAVGRAGET